MINGRGFEVKAVSEAEIKLFLKEYEEAPENAQNAFFEKWVRFDTYRRVVMQSNRK